MANPSVCSAPGCDNPHYAAGYCTKHYQRVRRYGDPFACQGTPPGSPLQWMGKAICQDTDECIAWPFKVDNTGYGRIRYKGKRYVAHRLALILFSGENREHLEAAHGPCHNPLCCNPKHLYWATRSQNQRDRTRDGTDNRGSNNAHAKLTEEQVLAIRRDPRMQKDIAAEYGVSRPRISMIKRYKEWKHVN